MMDVAFGVIGFTLTILVLVAILLVAKSRLVASGAVEIAINDDPDHTLTAYGGGTLLGTLADNQIFIPSACGGQGTCGVCLVKVHEGGGAILPTELGHISRGEAREGCRLSCQVKVKEDMRIEIPPEVFSVRKWACRVRSNHNVATFIKELVLAYKDFDVEEEYREDWDRFDQWKFVSKVTESVERAYSMANYPEEKGIILLNIRVASPPRTACSSRSAGTEPGQIFRPDPP